MSVTVQNLYFSYGEHPVLQDVSLHTEYSEFISVLGPNGAGKSTLFRCILGLLQPASGSIYIDGIPIATLSAISNQSFIPRFLLMLKPQEICNYRTYNTS